MAAGTGTIVELRLESHGFSARITCPLALRPAPGQYLSASSPNQADPLPQVLYPTGYAGDAIDVAGPLPAVWTTGMELALRGPLGSGFHMPQAARRVALASLDGFPARLLPLAHQALARQAAVAVYTNEILPGLPAEVELLPLDLLPEAPGWADFLALEIAPANLPDLRQRLGLKPIQRLDCPTQVLVLAAMPCTGIGECGVCAVPTRRGWLLACTDGPVFDYQLLEGG
jgi:NAD(P)H-flavin reductase